MIDAKHSPLPWANKFDGDIFSGSNCIACCTSEDERLDRTNAALIVRAVNAMPAFEQLLEAAKEALELGSGHAISIVALRKGIATAKEALK